MSVNIFILHDPFDPTKQSVSIAPFEFGKTVGDYVSASNELIPTDLEIVYAKNGIIVESTEEVFDGDSICASIKVGAETIALWAMSIAASVTGAGAFSVGVMMVGLVAYYGTMFAMAYGLGWLLNEFLGPDDPQISASGSPTYGWGPLQQLETPGHPIALVFGTHRVTGMTIGQRIDIEGTNKEYLSMMISICEGPVDEISDIYINDQPIYYFRDVEYDTRLGTLNDSVIDLFNEVDTQTRFNKRLSHSTWSTVRTQGNAVSKLKIDLCAAEGLYHMNASGTVAAITVDLEVKYRKVGDVSWTNVTETRFNRFWESLAVPLGPRTVEVKIANSATLATLYADAKGTVPLSNPFTRSGAYIGFYVSYGTYDIFYNSSLIHANREIGSSDNLSIRGIDGSVESIRKQIIVDGLEEAQYEVAIKRVDEETNFRNQRDGVWWQGLSEILAESFIYPGIARYSVRALATDQLSGEKPRTSCLVKKLTVKVYDQDLSQWVDKDARNPAWAAYALLNTYGPVPYERIDFDEFDEWADYCDEDISGDGSNVPRHQINLVIDTSDTLWNWVQRVAKLGRAVVIKKGRIYTPIISSVVNTVSHLFTMGNIVENSFSLGYIPNVDRSNAIECTYADEDTDYANQTVIVFGSDATEEDYSRKASINLFGITNQNRIIRECVFRINQNKWLTRTVSFEAFIDSFPCVVGDVFYFQHEVPDYENGKSGRIISASNSGGNGKVLLDQSVTIEVGITYSVIVRINNTDELIEKNVVLNSGPFVIQTSELTLTTTWSTIPDGMAPYAFGKRGAYKREYRLTNITRATNLTRKIDGIEYIEEVFDDSHGVIVLPPWDPAYQEATSVTLNEFLSYSSDGSFESNVNVSWFPAISASSNWVVWIQNLTEGTDPIVAGVSTQLNFIITSQFLVLGDTYRVIVVVEGQGAVERAGNYADIEILGKEAAPSDVTQFEAVFNTVTRSVNFSWSAVSDIDFSYYEIRMGGSSWETAEVILTGLTGLFASYFIEDKTQDSFRFWIKAVDTSGNESDNANFADVIINTQKCDLQTPTGLTLTSTSWITKDGRDVALLTATWNNNAEIHDHWHHYELELKHNDSGNVSQYSTDQTMYQWEVRPSTEYEVTVRAIAYGITMPYTAWSESATIVTSSDENPPNVPTGITLTAFFSSIRIRWSHSGEWDLSHFEVFRNSVNNSSTAAKIGNSVKDFTGKLVMFSDDPGNYQTYYYWVVAVDNSGNRSAFSAVVSGAKLHVQAVNLDDAIITTQHLADGAVDTDKLANLAITAAKLSISCVEETHIANLAVGTAAIQALAVGTAHIANASIITAKIGDLAVNTAKIADNAIVGGKIQAAAIATDHLEAGCVVASKIDVAELSAISADLGTITSGLITSQTWGNSAGTKIDLDYEVIKLGGDSNPKFHWNGSSLSIVGSIQVTGGFGLNQFTDAGTLATKDTVNWGTEVVGSGKPANNADVTSQNTAADTALVNGIPSSRVRGWAHASNTTYINGGNIFTGSITADQIATNAITAAKIRAGAITSDKITVNTITADKVYANAYLGDGQIRHGDYGTLLLSFHGSWETRTYTITHNMGRYAMVQLFDFEKLCRSSGGIPEYYVKASMTSTKYKDGTTLHSYIHIEVTGQTVNKFDIVHYDYPDGCFAWDGRIKYIYM